MAVEAVARSYHVGDRFGFDWLRQAASRLTIEVHWDSRRRWPSSMISSATSATSPAA